MWSCKDQYTIIYDHFMIVYNHYMMKTDYIMLCVRWKYDRDMNSHWSATSQVYTRHISCFLSSAVISTYSDNFGGNFVQILHSQPY
jgi:hypothetical protein